MILSEKTATFRNRAFAGRPLLRVVLAAIGRLKADAELALCSRYLARAAALGRSLGGLDVSVREFAESRAQSVPERRRAEAAALSQALSPGARTVALDEHGRVLSSLDFAADLRRARDSGAPVYALLIGGADGLAPDLCARADLVMSFGAMTWPHQLARAMAAEQIYRAMTILAGHPYHRG